MSIVFDVLSLAALYCAIALYILAFFLPNRRSPALVADEADTEPADGPTRSTSTSYPFLAWMFQLAAIVFRLLADGRPPVQGTYELCLTVTFILVSILLASPAGSRPALPLTTGFIAAILAVSAVRFYTEPGTMQPALWPFWATLQISLLVLAAALTATLYQYQRHVSASQHRN